MVTISFVHLQSIDSVFVVILDSYFESATLFIYFFQMFFFALWLEVVVLVPLSYLFIFDSKVSLWFTD
ncbi:hypothetical protein COCSADRAFT_262515 [Bipolaris sorokiniana ND90Pr]|uniref:Uncharacterized protein n=1 Tax=Cochliobolus sativus (strain ND90Pr / ATCC 201652) TaxID=665912 RepID=M2SQG4_COCSN|nr:uncharacterized protein COCSADRAFT_262515 [Bipolaris sorokiniana ND90Pr]EMD58992.1 hypothetical protein COCSADRAFT_262515 [Bipolaris sorokiniana ND90Pr]